MTGIKRWRRKPYPMDREDQYAARYLPGESLDDLARVAQMADRSAELAEVPFPVANVTVLVVRWLRVDDHGNSMEYETVEPGQWLAYSRDNDHLYTSSDSNWAQFYDEVPP